jgi:hypothetical protein
MVSDHLLSSLLMHMQYFSLLVLLYPFDLHESLTFVGQLFLFLKFY